MGWQRGVWTFMLLSLQMPVARRNEDPSTLKSTTNGDPGLCTEHQCVHFEVHMSPQSRVGFRAFPWHVGKYLPKCPWCHLPVATRCDRSRGNACREFAPCMEYVVEVREPA